MPTQSELSTAAHDHLPPAMADSWLGLLRPAVRLVHADDTATAVGHLGGVPDLPGAMPWPHWDGHGPLTYIAGIDCAGLSRQAVPVGLPDEGQLLFFYFDGQVDGGEAIILPGDASAQAGARVLYVTGAVAPRNAPEGITQYRRVPLTTRTVVTAPSYDHPALHDVFGTQYTHGTDHPLRSGEFWKVIWSDSPGPLHQLGGYPWPIQGDVEYEVAKLGVGELRDWVLLAQFDSDDRADMMWGDSGMLYWLIRADDLAARRFDRAAFTWQCC